MWTDIPATKHTAYKIKMRSITTNADIYMALQNAAKLNLHKLGQDMDRHTCYQTYKHIKSRPCKLHTRIHFSRLPCTSEEVKKWRC